MKNMTLEIDVIVWIFRIIGIAIAVIIIMIARLLMTGNFACVKWSTAEKMIGVGRYFYYETKDGTYQRSNELVSPGENFCIQREWKSNKETK